MVIIEFHSSLKAFSSGAILLLTSLFTPPRRTPPEISFASPAPPAAAAIARTPPRGPAQDLGRLPAGAHGANDAGEAPRGPRPRTAGELPDLELKRTHQVPAPPAPAAIPPQRIEKRGPIPFALPGVRLQARIAPQEAKDAARSRFA